ncbi:transposase [Saccharomonospora amisosensis]|uniref:Transposase n=1 Tax=Saccharomonospora amisosensis TaxID=1128677 RepID=A0A7X5USW0_9PSEU|nr:IS110 family transposase [Saccharomonospora amisosensis]NIJ13109.1 transposase [Saccharomonospora amisosensis]NIJ13182.1 transposase [Saccharomonospora amisosensis]NIJ13189.1 transposase [Saccharomonospora amisosensis]NIJ14175.1 transposase [Saccharomonospora amisosensis]NIJ14660.1 transposase [Saccharomonospora amisosensis]
MGVGIDWAESFHDVALGRPDNGIVEQFRIDHTAAGVGRLIARCLELETDPADVRVVLETRHGVLVEALTDAGFTVLPVNPDLVARRRGPAKKKDDAEDARICCLLALDQFLELRKLIPHGNLAGELRSIARDDERAARDQRRLLNRLRADLLATFPAALTIAGDDLGSPVMLKLLATWPTHAQLAGAGTDAIESFARSSRHGWPDRFAARVADALTVEQLPVRDYLIRAKATTISLTATQLLALREARKSWERRMAELLLGDTRYGRAKQPRNPDPGKAIPGGDIYLSFPGLGDILAARIAGEIGDHIEQFDTPNGLQCYAGTAPVTRRSGRSELVIARRLAHNRYLGTAVHQWAFCTLTTSTWAREFYDRKITAGKAHHSALRALANRWLEILWHCLTKGIRYDEAVHIRNRSKTLQTATAA